MRIAYLWDADYPWDVRTEKVCTTLTAAGHEAHIIARNRAWQVGREALPEGVVHRMRPWRWAGHGLDTRLSFPAFFSPRWRQLVRRVLQETAAEAIIVRDLPLCPTAVWAGRAAGIPVVLDMAENYPAMIQAVWTAGRQKPWDVLTRNPRLVRAVEDWCLPRVQRILVVVEESAERLVRLGVPRERLVVVSNTPPRERATTAAPDRADGAPIQMVYLGLMEIPRGVGELLEAVAGLRATGRPFRLHLIGDGRDRHLFEAQAARLGLTAPHVTFLGHVPNAAALALVAQADIGLIPHHADEAWNTTIPNKLFDYMAAGLAVATSDAAPAARIVRETGAGVVFRSGDAASCTAALAQLFDAPTRTRAAAAARQAILDTYHWERDATRLVSTIGTLAETGGRAPRPAAVTTIT